VRPTTFPVLSKTPAVVVLMFYTPDFNEAGLSWNPDEIATRTGCPVEVCMYRMFALCILLVGFQSGCTDMHSAYATCAA
jgi:hypothetical protein